MAEAGVDPWMDAELAAGMVALAPHELGGILLRARAGPVRDAWLARLRSLLPADAPWRRIPLHISESRLLGGLDLTATLSSGRPIAQTGLLEECNGGVALLVMAERASRSTVAHLAAALDEGTLVLARETRGGTVAAAFGVLALDEGEGDDEPVAPALSDRLALDLDLHEFGIRDIGEETLHPAAIRAARERFPQVTASDELVRSLCGAAEALGVQSPRAMLLALRAARAAAAIDGRPGVEEEDIGLAVRLVLLPRATRVPASQAAEAEAEPQPEPAEGESAPPEPPPDAPEPSRGEDAPEPPAESEPAAEQELPSEPPPDQLLAAALASMPPNLLARLAARSERSRRQAASGKSGAAQRHSARGRPMGAMPGDPRSGARLSLVATLRAAAPWQAVRRAGGEREGVRVQKEDFRVVRFRQRRESTTIFAVDASGSTAMNRLAEAKGAIELLLAECYVRRDRVAMVAFRGESAELLLPPTRSLVRARRGLAGLPGGGGTPLASALELVATLVDQIQRNGGTPAYVMLTDGRANIARDGTRGRETATADAVAVASLLRASGASGMVVDTSPRPRDSAAELAAALGAIYLPLPHADASALRDAVRVVA
jgi:magnesium chelatase subunit D